MRIWTVLPVVILLAGCAAAPVTPRPEGLFDDRLFAAASERISASDVFAVSDEMRRYLSTDIAGQLRIKGNQQGLFDALYSEGQLKLEYDSVMTRNAAQAFAARSGNCLSLVIMTAAFAKELGLTVRYQSANVDDTWGRSGDVHFFIGHVNLTLGKPRTMNFGLRRNEDDLTIDFLAPYEIRGLHTREISEATVVAMFMNNRAAEQVAQGRLDDAYWWGRAAIEADPTFLSSYNTLGVIYRRHGNPANAERVLAYALDRDPRNTHVMSNLVQVLHDLGRDTESKALGRKLEQIEPNPAFSFFSQGMMAVRSGDFRTAKDMFAKEVDRAPYYHEFHYWLAIACIGLGEVDQARKQLAIAMETSTTQRDHAVYAAKLDRIKSSREPATRQQ